MTEELFRAEAYLTTCQARVIALVDNGIQLDRTVFYPTGGGQPGDTGSLITSDGRVIPIVDTQKGETGILQIPAEGSPPSVWGSQSAPASTGNVAIGTCACIRLYTCSVQW